MPSRSVKTFYKELGHRAHREHRSKRGRRNNYAMVKKSRRLYAVWDEKEERRHREGLHKICGKYWT